MSCPVDADAERKRYRDDCSESLGSVERTKARKTRREEVSHPSASSSGRVVDMDADRLTTEVSRLKKLLEAERHRLLGDAAAVPRVVRELRAAAEQRSDLVEKGRAHRQ